MLPLDPLLTPADAASMVARRLRSARVSAGWTQAELARRGGVSIATIARLERTGHGQLASLFGVLTALRRLGDLDGLLAPAAAKSLEDLRRSGYP